MNLIKILTFLFIGLFTFSFSYADDQDEIADLAQEVLKSIESSEGNKILDNNDEDEDVPLNDPFAGDEASSSTNANIPEDQIEDEMSLYNFKLAGLISGKDHSYISLVNSSGSFINLTLGQNLGKIKLIDLRINEAIFKKEDKSYLIIDFNNQIRESSEY